MVSKPTINLAKYPFLMTSLQGQTLLTAITPFLILNRVESYRDVKDQISFLVTLSCRVVSFSIDQSLGVLNDLAYFEFMLESSNSIYKTFVKATCVIISHFDRSLIDKQALLLQSKKIC